MRFNVGERHVIHNKDMECIKVYTTDSMVEEKRPALERTYGAGTAKTNELLDWLRVQFDKEGGMGYVFTDHNGYSILIFEREFQTEAASLTG